MKLRELDSRVHQRVEDVAEESAHHGHETAQEYDTHDNVVITIHHGIVIEEAHAVDVEDLLDKEGPCKHLGTDLGEAGGDGN